VEIEVKKTAAMKPLRRADMLHLEAAQGWIELDNPSEAQRELDAIEAACLENPEVLELRWKTSAMDQHWDICLDLAETLVDVAPRKSTGWLYLAASLHSLRHPEEAYETLVEVVDSFSNNPAIPYQLACYACEMRLWNEAKTWLDEAFVRGNSDELKVLALQDSSLQPFWEHMAQRTANV